MAFPIVMYGCESWTIKKAECRRTDAFVLWCWRTLESLLDCKEIKPVNPKGINHEYSLEGLMLKLKLQYAGHLMWKADSFEKTLMLGKIEGGRRRRWQGWAGWMASPLNGQGFGWTLRVGDGQGGQVCCDSCGCKESDTTERMNGTELQIIKQKLKKI